MHKLFAGLGIFGVLSYLGIIAAGVIGWIMNIFALIGTVNGPLDGVFVLRIVGIFVAPLGAIMGLFF